MLVDPEILRAFSGHVDTASAAITAADLGATVSSAGDGLPASTTQWAAHSVGEHLASMADGLAENVAKMGQAVRGAADTFEVADDALAGSFDGLF
ncbi:type VII secretion target [Mycolicibacterium tusciae]|uniref:type VII secretion target n=1 Tax=Mycolicibacterium tusciae TaxID=75922 RepID=UPI00024A368F|nr:type VII secretion target [Mycolicibacterium tusciae]